MEGGGEKTASFLAWRYNENACQTALEALEGGGHER